MIRSAIQTRHGLARMNATVTLLNVSARVGVNSSSVLPASRDELFTSALGEMPSEYLPRGSYPNLGYASDQCRRSNYNCAGMAPEHCHIELCSTHRYADFFDPRALLSLFARLAPPVLAAGGFF